MATRKDVAMRAGVSVATVSNVINHSKNVTPDVERRVRDAIEALNYRPNLLARSLSTRETHHVAMLVDNLYDPYYAEMLAGVQAEASEMGYIVSVICVDLSYPNDISDLASRGVDGAILALYSDVPKVEALLGPQLSTARIGRWLRVDYQDAMNDMVALLKRKGHRRIAFLNAIPTSNRLEVWKRAMKRHGLEVDEDLIINGIALPDQAEGIRAMELLLKKEVPFTAGYASNDLVALGAMRTLHLHGLRVPGDISVVGCGQLQVLRSMTPTLASMDIHAFELGRCLMRQLTEEIAATPHETLIIPARFAPGESIDSAPTNDERQSS